MATHISPEYQKALQAGAASFLFRVDEVKTNDDPSFPNSIPARQINNLWIPPDHPFGWFAPVPGDLYRWTRGSVESAVEYESFELGPYWLKASTVVWCNDFYQFYTADGYANLVDMSTCDWVKTWQRLHFRHEGPVSCADHAGGDAVMVKRASWIEELIPKAYRPEHTVPNAKGLGGRLAILAALAAFSCKDRATFHRVLLGERCWRDWTWHPHRKPRGRSAKRALIVTVWMDPSNLQNSTGDLLDYLEEEKNCAFFQ